jgi:hypothetical protein
MNKRTNDAPWAGPHSRSWVPDDMHWAGPHSRSWGPDTRQRSARSNGRSSKLRGRNNGAQVVGCDHDRPTEWTKGMADAPCGPSPDKLGHVQATTVLLGRGGGWTGPNGGPFIHRPGRGRGCQRNCVPGAHLGERPGGELSGHGNSRRGAASGGCGSGHRWIAKAVLTAAGPGRPEASM